MEQLLTTGSVSLDEEQKAAAGIESKELVSVDRVRELEEQLKEQSEYLDRVLVLNKELVTYKRNKLREERVYIVSTASYARQGVYKIGRTRNRMALRLANHNVSHAPGDRVKVLREFRVGNSKLVERTIHDKLSGLSLDGEREFFLCPYDLLEALVEAIVEKDEESSVEVNRVISIVYQMRTSKFSQEEWLRGVPADFLQEAAPRAVVLTESKEPVVEFELDRLTEQQRREFVDECMRSYLSKHATPSSPFQLVWKSFQPFLVDSLRAANVLPTKKQYRANDWRDIAKDVAEQQPNIVFVQRVRPAIAAA